MHALLGNLPAWLPALMFFLYDQFESSSYTSVTAQESGAAFHREYEKPASSFRR
jgi:hypothetical protein